MKIPRLDTILVRKNYIDSSVQMRIPTDLNKPVLANFQNTNIKTNNSKLNYIA